MVIYKRFNKSGYEIKGWEYGTNQFWRIFSIPAAQMLSKFKVRPEPVAFASFILGVLAAVFYGAELNIGPLLGGLLFALCWFIDFVDGDLARLTSQTSILGGWLDSLYGKIITPLVYFAVCLTCARTHTPGIVWKMGFVLMGSYFVFSMLKKTTDQLAAGAKRKQPDSGNKQVDTIEKNFLQVIVREILLGPNTLNWILIFGGLFNQLYFTLVISTCYSLLFLGISVYFNCKIIKLAEIRS